MSASFSITAGINSWYGTVNTEPGDSLDTARAALADLRTLIAEASAQPHPNVRNAPTVKSEASETALDTTTKPRTRSALNEIGRRMLDWAIAHPVDTATHTPEELRAFKWLQKHDYIGAISYGRARDGVRYEILKTE